MERVTPKVIDIDLSFPKETFSIDFLIKEKNKFGFTDIKERPDALIFSHMGTNIVIYPKEIRARSIDNIDSVIPLIDKVLKKISELYDLEITEEPIEIDMDVIYELKSKSLPAKFFKNLMNKKIMEPLAKEFPEIIPSVRFFLNGVNTKRSISVRIEPLIRNPKKFFIHINYVNLENKGHPNFNKIYTEIFETWKKVLNILINRGSK